MNWILTFAAAAFAFHFWRKYRQRQKELNSPLAEHRLGMKHIGQVVVLEMPLKDGVGRVQLGNRTWEVRGPELPKGARARVTGVDGTVLLLDRAAA